MQIVRTIANLPANLRPCAVAIGNFDGVHRGHARIVERLLAKSRELQIPAVVFTFDPHPLKLLRPEASPPPITTPSRKIELLKALGVDGLIVYPTDSSFLSLTAEQFFEQMVRQALDARAMVEGPNFYFGRNRGGNVDRLQVFCESAQIDFEVVQPCDLEGELISSSRIRELIQVGRMGVANQCLTQPFRLQGQVVTGAARGRTIGFPTANLALIETVVPGPGVYIARTMVNDRWWPAAVNIGSNPTFGESMPKVEVHIIGFTGELYGQWLEVDLLDRLRDIQKFDSVVELVSQLRRDIAECREYCNCGGYMKEKN